MSNTTNKPTVPEVLPIAQAIYNRNAMGCCLHIVLDDDNVQDQDVRFCYEKAIERGHSDCAELAAILLRMSKTQRLKMGERVDHNPGYERMKLHGL